MESNYIAKYTVLAQHLLDASAKKPDNPTLKEMIQALTEIAIYVNYLEIERREWKLTTFAKINERDKLKLEIRDLKEKYMID
jgi:hypothetical protein